MQRCAPLIRTMLVRRARRPVTGLLLAGLLFELSLLTGVIASPFFAARAPAELAPLDDAAGLLVRWRGGVYQPWLDPRLGQTAPALGLRTPAGQPIGLADLRGKKVALLFVPDGGG